MKDIGGVLRYLAWLLAAGIVVVGIGQQGPATVALNDTPNVTVYAVTHVCGNQVCGR